MNSKRSKVLLNCGILLCFLMVATISASEEETPESTSIEFSCISWQALGGQAVYFQDGENYVPLDLKRGRRSHRVKATQADTLRLFVRGGEAGSEYAELASLGLPESEGSLLLLLNKERNGEVRDALVDLVPDPAEQFPRGGVVFTNLSDDVLEVLLADEVLSVRPAESVETAKSIPDAGGFIPLQLKDASGQMVLETRIYGQPAKCKMVFIYPPKIDGHKYSVKFITELHTPLTSQ